jgi:hypothetical protein
MLRVSKAFFSYSRHDSEFTLKLAKDLRAAGASVWMDQLDISAGRHWDTAVEKAIGVSSSLLIVLSPDSIQSENVMDEVAYALEEGKLVIPVLYRDCKIPLRLRRLQYIDVRTNYEAGLAEIRKMLESDQQSDTSLSSRREEEVTAQADQQEREKAQAQQAAQARENEGRLAVEDAERRERQRLELQARERESAAQQGEPQEAAKPAQVSTSKARILGLIAAAFVVIVILFVWIANVANKPQPIATREPESNTTPISSNKMEVPDVKPPSANNSASNTQNQATQAVPALDVAHWVEGVLKASEGPSVDDLRPFYDTTVSPYFKRFPRIEYTLTAAPREFPQSNDSTNIEYDVQYSNLRKDGVIVNGTSHVWASLRRIDGQWKITGISERVQ